MLFFLNNTPSNLRNLRICRGSRENMSCPPTSPGYSLGFFLVRQLVLLLVKRYVAASFISTENLLMPQQTQLLQPRQETIAKLVLIWWHSWDIFQIIMTQINISLSSWRLQCGPKLPKNIYKSFGYSTLIKLIQLSKI